MRLVNLLGTLPKTVRDPGARRANKELLRARAMKFGAEYFDGSRDEGYGGYHYDGRWESVARRVVAHFQLKPGERVLDVGCAKGFFVHDLGAAVPDLDVYGLDISNYALTHAHPGASGRLVRGTCDRLPFADRSFAAVLSFNTLHNLDRAGCVQALREIERLAPGRGFVQVDAYRTDAELHVFLEWMLTAKTFLTPEAWLELFAEAGYTGDYYWTILGVDGDVAQVTDASSRG